MDYGLIKKLLEQAAKARRDNVILKTTMVTVLGQSTAHDNLSYQEPVLITSEKESEDEVEIIGVVDAPVKRIVRQQSTESAELLSNNQEDSSNLSTPSPEDPEQLPFKCKSVGHCCESFTTQEALRAHHGVHVEQLKLFICKECRLATFGPFDYRIHRLEDNCGPARDGICSPRLKGTSSISVAVLGQLKQMDIYVCEKCLTVFDSSDDLKDHRWRGAIPEPNVLDSNIGTNPSYCDHECKFPGCSKRLKQAAGLRFHYITHFRMMGLYLCWTCREYFDHHAIFQAHYLIMHPKQSLKVKNLTKFVVYPDICGFPDCKQTFAYFTSMTSHRHEHCQAFGFFLCEMCRKFFNTAADLKAHSRTSSTEHLVPQL